MSFNFGTTAVAAPAASSGFSFGASTPAASAAPATGGGFSFGSGAATTATPAPAASGAFSFGGGAATTPAPAASGGFSFGGTTATTAPTASRGFNFGGGASTTATVAPASGGFSFGGASTATAAPASTGFSFGGTASTSAAPTASGGFSFGGATTAAAPASSGGFSFGAAAPATSTTGGSLFGGATTATPTPSLFGGASTTGGSSLFGAKPAGMTSLFGGGSAPAVTTTTPGFGGFSPGGFGAEQSQQAAAAAQPAIKLETTFDALPADVKKNMTDFHKFLKDEDQSDTFLKSVSARKLDTLKANLDQLEQDVLVRRNLQDRQATAVHHVRKDVKHLINQVDTATLNLRSMSGESTSQKFYGIMRRVDMPSPYYWELLDTFEARMEQLKTQIECVESEFKPLYDKQRRAAGGGGAGGGYDAASLSGMDPALLQQILVLQNNALIQVAAHVAEVHEKTEEMRQAFIRKMKEDMLKHGDKNLAAFKSPFDKKKKNSASRESDIDNIRFKTSVAPTIVATQPQPTAQQPTATTGFGGFGTTTASTGTTGFGTTPTFGQPATSTSTSGSSLFGGAGATTSTAAPAASIGGGFSFGGSTATSTAPKQVSFSLSTSSAPTVSTNATSTGVCFGAPATPVPGVATTAAAPGGFGAVGSSFLPASTPAFGAGDKRAATAAGSKSGGLRSRQKKR